LRNFGFATTSSTRDSGRSEHPPMLVRSSQRERSLRGARRHRATDGVKRTSIPLRRFRFQMSGRKHSNVKRRRDIPRDFGLEAPRKLRLAVGCGTERVNLASTLRCETKFIGYLRHGKAAKLPKDLERGTKPRKNRVWSYCQRYGETTGFCREQGHEVVETARWQRSW